MLANHFAQVFRQEHREIRDALFALAAAFKDRDKERISQAIYRTVELTGPHFRYEEEALYPSLIEIFGQDYVEKLFAEHDRAIGTAEALAELAAKANLDNRDAQRASDLVRSILPHVSDCEGLSIMVEAFPDERVREILDARETCRREELNLLRWATKMRKRPHVRVQAEERPAPRLSLEPDPSVCIPGA